MQQEKFKHVAQQVLLLGLATALLSPFVAFVVYFAIAQADQTQSKATAQVSLFRIARWLEQEIAR
ncbi:MAG: hypothetical protein ACK41E_01140 [Deinococcales bacterium]